MVRRAAVLVVGALVAGAAARADVTPPLVGGDYYGTACTGLSNVLRDTVDATLEREQMFAMHASGLNSIALVVNYSTDPGHLFDGHGGAMPIGLDGSLIEPYRSDLVRYLTDAKDAGFIEITIRFQAHGPNSPEPWTSGGYVDEWNPALYSADWAFIQNVRALTKQYGPAQSHFDLMGEGPPSDYGRSAVGSRLDEFMTQLYVDYVHAYGNGDVFFSFIGDDTGRLAHEIQDLLAAGVPLPQWWGMDPEYTGPLITIDLQRADAKLQEYHLGGSIVLEETAYESTEVAGAVQAYNATAAHPVVQIEEYPYYGTPQCVDPPFTGNAYLSIFGLSTPPLRLTLDPKGHARMTTADGVGVIALEAGQYTIVATDSSRTAGLKLSAFGVARRTTAAFRGTVTWTVDLDAGLTWVSGAKGTRAVTFPILP